MHILTSLRTSRRLSLLYPPPQPWILARSLPVPSGSIAIGGFLDSFMSSFSSASMIHATVPSPPHTSILDLGRAENDLRTRSGGPDARSWTWMGFRTLRSWEIRSLPWLPPDFEFTNTTRGVLGLASEVSECGERGTSREPTKNSSPPYLSSPIPSKTYPLSSGSTVGCDIFLIAEFELAASKKAIFSLPLPLCNTLPLMLLLSDDDGTFSIEAVFSICGERRAKRAKVSRIVHKECRHEV